jgi:nitrite reductase/ring-hydroxylating ferredoxin subunit
MCWTGAASCTGPTDAEDGCLRLIYGRECQRRSRSRRAERECCGWRIGVKFVVAPLSEFPSGTRRIVRVGGREIGVFRVEHDFYAVRNRCPHQGGPLCRGRVLPRLVADEPGAVRIGDGPPLIVCPWHGWQYDARTGEAFAPGDPGARSYEVTVEPGTVVPRESDEHVRFVAETFPVYLENDYVVLEA